MTLTAACLLHGVKLNDDHVAEVSNLFNGEILKALLALVTKYGPAIAGIMPKVLADLAAKDYAAALLLIVTTLAGIQQ